MKGKRACVIGRTSEAGKGILRGAGGTAARTLPRTPGPARLLSPVKKRMGSDSPKPDPYGHSRGLPQSFTRSQKERPLGEYIVALPTPPLVAIVLHSHDEFETGIFLLSGGFPPESLSGRGRVEEEFAEREARAARPRRVRDALEGDR